MKGLIHGYGYKWIKSFLLQSLTQSYFCVKYQYEHKQVELVWKYMKQSYSDIEI